MAARLRVLQPGNPECASEREEKENEMEGEGGGGKKEDAKRKKWRREEPSSLFISLPGRSTFYLPPRAHTCI